MLPRVADPAFTPDLIDVHWTYPDIVTGYWLARRRGCKLLVTVRGKEALYPGERSVRRWMLRHCLRHADAVITLSDELKQLVVEFGVPPGRVRTILNGVDRSRFFSRPGVECRQRLGIPADARVLISVGSLVERKGHHELIKVMPELTRSHPGVRLYIIGGRGPEGDMSATLRSMIAERGLTNVYLIDKVDHAALADWYGAADVFCLATKGEGCPNVVLEALACGAPVVATDVGAIRELVSDGVNGFVVGAGSAAELGPAIERALRHNWDRAHIAEDMDRWGWAKCADQVIETYRSVLQARDPQRATGNLT
jgi:glycosyltransferase involved in cell wall biosynthesis